jgi:hypothetical protein
VSKDESLVNKDEFRQQYQLWGNMSQSPFHKLEQSCQTLSPSSFLPGSQEQVNIEAWHLTSCGSFPKGVTP